MKTELLKHEEFGTLRTQTVKGETSKKSKGRRITNFLNQASIIQFLQKNHQDEIHI